ISSHTTPISQTTQLVQKRQYRHWYQKKTGWRYWKYQLFDRYNLPAEGVIYGLIASFVAVYALKSFVPHFPDLAYSKGRSYLYLFTAIFDHASLGHLFSNCLFIFFMGSMFPASVSAGAILSIFVLGGAGATLLSEAYSNFQANRALNQRNMLRYRIEQHSRSCGASGGIFALLAVETLVMPFRPILFMGIVPMKSWVFLAALLGFETYQIMAKEARWAAGAPPAGTQIGNAAHVGGAIMGTAMYFVMRRFRL
ncbi:uncharacterized protein V2V93DRAFT_308973, partial [Kockiozyma suomiensis]|uniref:uncharacterized protein n=1 Tax=Kockiozyma suomiensis TaxID=1337062 RepID=UPI0033439F54